MTDPYYQEYSEYAKNIRLWFVAYGVGGPALLLTQPALYDSISRSDDIQAVAIAYFAGVIVQILTALLYKAAAWNLHRSKERGQGRPSRWAERVESWYWLDLVADLTTLALFAFATVCVLRALPVTLKAAA
jgi:hypothetical protein